jgi:hypothetical protein
MDAEPAPALLGELVKAGRGIIEHVGDLYPFTFFAHAQARIQIEFLQPASISISIRYDDQAIRLFLIQIGREVESVDFDPGPVIGPPYIPRTEHFFGQLYVAFDGLDSPCHSFSPLAVRGEPDEIGPPRNRESLCPHGEIALVFDLITVFQRDLIAP